MSKPEVIHVTATGTDKKGKPVYVDDSILNPKWEDICARFRWNWEKREHIAFRGYCRWAIPQMRVLKRQLGL